MFNDGTNFLKLTISVTSACSEDYRPHGDVTPESAARYICGILQIAFGNLGYHTDVLTVQYPPGWKIPLIVEIGEEQRLLWFYPEMPTPDLAAELYGLLSDVVVKCPCVPA